VEHLEGKGRESDVAIMRFLCGGLHSCQLRTASFWPRWQAFITTLSNGTSLLLVVLVFFGRGMRPRAKTSTREHGPDFDLVGTCEWFSYLRASGSQAYDV
jgi:hypothetical protein